MKINLYLNFDFNLEISSSRDEFKKKKVFSLRFKCKLRNDWMSDYETIVAESKAPKDRLASKKNYFREC